MESHAEVNNACGCLSCWFYIWCAKDFYAVLTKRVFILRRDSLPWSLSMCESYRGSVSVALNCLVLKIGSAQPTI